MKTTEQFHARARLLDKIGPIILMSAVLLARAMSL
jgi:hypothetical protein